MSGLASEGPLWLGRSGRLSVPGQVISMSVGSMILLSRPASAFGAAGALLPWSGALRAQHQAQHTHHKPFNAHDGWCDDWQ